MTQFFLERKVFTYFFAVLLIVAGVLSFFSLGQLEDPIFTVKKALIITEYPGADPEEVELEVTDVIEKALTEITELDNTYSWSRAGKSIIKVEIKQQFWSDVLPQKWDLVRKKIKDNLHKLPPGAGVPDVIDDFSFVYGFVLAITGDGFSYRQLEDYADDIKKELEVVQGVARVDLWGVQPRVIYLDVPEAQLAELGVSPENLADTLQIQNRVVNAGWVDVADRRMRFAPTGEFSDPQEIGELSINPSTPELVLSEGRAGSFSAAQAPVFGGEFRGARGGTYSPSKGSQEATQIIRIRDLATVREGYQEPPPEIMRFDGKPALGIKIAGLDEFNVVDTGQLLEARLQELLADLPVGIELHKVAWQSRLVSEATNGFMLSLAMAVAIVLIVLMVPSGFRMGLIIGSMLIFIILGTFIGMAITATPLQKMSLGALIIAMGMMVDNSCFVADDMGVRISRGQDRKQAGIEAGNTRAWPLFGATVIATMTFYPIFASAVDAGEYCRTLFTVVAIALMFSWFISLTLTPAMCDDLLPAPKEGEEPPDPFDSAFFRGLRSLIELCIRRRWATLGIVGLVLVAALASYPNVRQMFFPFATRDQLKVDVWAPEGSRIQDVSAIAAGIEEKLMTDPRVVSVATFVGNGPPRYYLPEDPENPNSTYAQIVVNTLSYDEVNPLAQDIEPWLAENVPAMTRVRLYDVGPADTWKFEARLSGPAQADLKELRGIGNQIMEILRRSPLAREVRSEMRNPVQKLVPVYHQERGRWANITRQEMANATLRSHDGMQVGLYREDDDLLPIVLRNIESERATVAGGGLVTLQVSPKFSTQTVPLAQVTDGVHTEWEDPIIHRWQRRRAMTIQASPNYGETFPSLYADVIDEINAIEMPPGYEIFWDGEFDSSVDAQASLLTGVPVTLVLMLLIIMLLYNSIRVLICIMLTIPFAAIGVIFGLWALDSPMGFVAILGILSLMGMMIKNMIVLTDAIKGGEAEGMDPFEACVQGAVTQARPIALAAGTTVLGVIPLFPDPFWNAMAASIMGGLSVGAALTIVLFPTLYATLHGIHPPDAPASQESAA